MKRVFKEGKMMRAIQHHEAGIAKRYTYGFEPDAENSKKAYLILQGGDATNKLTMKNDDYLGKSYKETILSVRNIDGAPHTVILVNKKYIENLMRQETAHTAYAALSQYLTDKDIEICFYELWREERNLQAFEAERKAYNSRLVGRRKKVGKGERRDHAYIKKITSGMSVRQSSQVM